MPNSAYTPFYVMDKEKEQKPSLLPEQTPAKREEKILEFWRARDAFAESVARRARRKRFVFYEGPPYANGKPGIHHVEVRTFKDALLRYKTMRGFFVERRAGWDTHGLPTEVEVEKKLGIKTKKDIERLGVETFVEEARKNVFLYKEEWERMTERMGYWVDLKRAYVTMARPYIESLWWILARLHAQELLYRDKRVVPWCPRCETALSSFEVAQGYEAVSEKAIYVKFPTKDFEIPAAFLAWTTTPWTLPGNVALAVSAEALYVLVKEVPSGEALIFARERMAALMQKTGKTFDIVREIRGSELVEKHYEPPYPAEGVSGTVVGADFVHLTEGTGIVHIAPAFGTDDSAVAKKERLPTLMTVDEHGLMDTEGYSWNRLFVKDADPLICADLTARGLIFYTEEYTHDYPFCWRCKSPLLYYAREAWWLRTTAVKDRMIAENKTVFWHPEYLRDGRFGEWLSENTDWNVSRERYWGAPLPLWECCACHLYTTASGLAALDQKDSAPTMLLLARHGEAEHNVTGIIGPVEEQSERQSALTARGRKQIERSAKRMADKNVDLILTSPLRRARQTAELYSQAWGGTEILVREELREIDAGSFVGKTTEEYHTALPSAAQRLTVEPEQGEGLRALRRRVMRVVEYIRTQHRGKKIMIVSHGDPLWILAAAIEGADEDAYGKAWQPEVGEVREMRLHNWPYDREGLVDLHRPYVDAIILRCDGCGREVRRVSEVADVWFDSGAMPFAKDHWPFAQAKNEKLKIEKLGEKHAFELIKKINFPADYICEAIDQTRGWFYSLLAVSALLGFPAPYRHVLSLGLVLDAKGQKMSKSRGNATDPWTLFERYGADAVRWYFLTINQPWEEKRFVEKDVADINRRFLLIAENVLAYWKTYAAHVPAGVNPPKIVAVLDSWLVEKTRAVISEITQLFEAYDIVKAARTLEAFMLEDISRWYIRRIRSDMKTPGSVTARKHAATLGWTLREYAKLLAPFAPFLAEEMHHTLTKSDKSSVHGEDWSTVSEKTVKQNALQVGMVNVLRQVIKVAFFERAQAGIKVRQPLKLLKVGENLFVQTQYPKKWVTAAREWVKGEVNVKDVQFGVKTSGVFLDTQLTAELKEEGMLRELVRQIQAWRKEEGLQPGEPAALLVHASQAAETLIKKHAAVLRREAGIISATHTERPPEHAKVLRWDKEQLMIARER